MLTNNNRAHHESERNGGSKAVQSKAAASAKTVRDIMNSTLLYIRDGDHLVHARRHIIEFGVTAVPILDEEHRPVGVVSLRDIAGLPDDTPFESTGVVAAIKDTTPIEAGARRLAESGHHHLVVVNDDGVAVGMVSAVDFLRGLTGLPPRHPEAFKRYE